MQRVFCSLFVLNVLSICRLCLTSYSRLLQLHWFSHKHFGGGRKFCHIWNERHYLINSGDFSLTLFPSTSSNSEQKLWLKLRENGWGFQIGTQSRGKGLINNNFVYVINDAPPWQISALGANHLFMWTICDKRVNPYLASWGVENIYL